MTFVWDGHLLEIVSAALLSMVPTFEGRYALLAMLSMGMPILFSYFWALFFSTLPMPLVLFLYLPFARWIQKLPYGWLGWLKRFCAWVERRAQRKASRMDTAGLLGLFAFVAIPLPGTGVWTGSIIAALFGFNRKTAALAILAGNVAACAITMAIALVVRHTAGTMPPWM